MLESRGGGVLPLTSLNHISLVCTSVEKSLDFYQNVLGFVPIRRPGSFNFNGAWLFNYGVGIHLLQSEDPDSIKKKAQINPKDNHISFQCESVALVEKKLKEIGIQYVQRRVVVEGGIHVDQLFFHDPDSFMIEICNCDDVPIIPLVGVSEPMGVCKPAASSVSLQSPAQQQPPIKVQCHAPAICVSEDSHDIYCA